MFSSFLKMRTSKLQMSVSHLLMLAATGCTTTNTVQAVAPEPVQPASCNGTSGCITTIIGSGEAYLGDDDVVGWKSAIYFPQDGITGPDGKFYYIDWENHRIRAWDSKSGMTATVAGNSELGDTGSGGPALNAHMNHPGNLAFNAAGDLLIAAWHNSRVKSVDFKTGLLTNLYGDGNRAFAGDGGPAAKCKFDLPSSVASDSKGNIYVSDQANQRIRKIDPATGNVSTVVGDNWVSDDGTKAGKPKMEGDFYVECRPVVDATGALIGHMKIADKDGDAIKLDVDGKTWVKKLTAGAPTKVPLPTPDLCGSFAGEGTDALHAHLWSQATQAATITGRIFIDKKDQMYIADTMNQRIRKVDLAVTPNIITTVAGNGTLGFSGDGGDALAAQLDTPVDVDVMADGTVLVAEFGNSCIRAIKDGKISTFAGQCKVSGFEGDGGDKLKAKFNRPYGVSVAPDGNIFVMDTHNHRVRLISK